MAKKTERILIIIPTYNESMNIRELVPAVLAADRRIEILFVDDNSPDGTAAIIKSLMKKDKRLHVIERPGKMGLGTAYIAGFRFALDAGYDFIFEMDADFSHHPSYLPELIKTLTGECDVVVGSRYIHGVSVAHWPIRRLLLSKLANVYAGFFTGVKVKDLTAGFVGYAKKVLEAITIETVRSSGYAFQIEMKYRCKAHSFVIKEVPIIFADRTLGESKISRGIVYEALYRCISLRWSYRVKKNPKT
ncbi:MAG: polyprenol monophosphomannose synthase [Spirochaetota bacterium]|jgi:dolichol-phosphate mannosyltransferase|nr:polyprenol monophosphomannose synthase [Spirochaetota bacterium]